MISAILEALAAFVILVISTLSYSGIFLTMAIESALIPLPSEIIMPFSGFLASQGRFVLIWVAIVGAFGNLFGSVLAYALGYWGHERVVRKLVKNWGKFILLTEHDLDTATSFFNKYGSFIVFLSRVLPGVRTYISLPAGIARYPIVKFCAFTFFGALIWSYILAYIGFVLGENWQTLGPYFHKFDFLIVVLGLFLVGFYLYHKLRPKRSVPQN